MTQLGERQRLFAELPSRRFICQQSGRQHFERYIAVQLLIVRTIDHSHTACTDLFDDAVVAKNVADELGRRLHGLGNARTCGDQCPTRAARSVGRKWHCQPSPHLGVESTSALFKLLGLSMWKTLEGKSVSDRREKTLPPRFRPHITRKVRLVLAPVPCCFVARFRRWT